jgi:dTDP-glucose 4,6-dehydratase
MTVLISGGAGFIGANFVHGWVAHHDEQIINLDKLTYAGSLENLAAVRHNDRHVFVHGDICDRDLVRRLLETYRPRAILNFAAETHVDRSIREPGEFVRTNILGTFAMVDEARSYWNTLPAGESDAFRFIQVSTDEVYGPQAPNDAPCKEGTAYQPSSPYAASKAGGDHLVRAYDHTYGLPTVITNCSNNYGPFQFPEKLIPLLITNANAGKPIPIYGNGRQCRDWLFVEDHCSALERILANGKAGESYNIASGAEISNIDLARRLCSILDQVRAATSNRPHERLIEFVRDRPGHDRRYAVDANKLRRELGWQPTTSLEVGLRKTVDWYLENDVPTNGPTSGGLVSRTAVEGRTEASN